MFLRPDVIRQSLAELRQMHPFFGVTFLVCKAEGLPVGSATHIPINKKETEFLERHYSPAPHSQYFYRAWGAEPRRSRWLRPDYAGSGSQKTRTTTFRHVFIHEPDTDEWGWRDDYVSLLAHHRALSGGRAPAFWLAVWLFRETDWSPMTTLSDIMEKLFRQFHITDQEKSQLFSLDVPELSADELFQDRQTTWGDLRRIVGRPPDAEPGEEGTLAHLELHSVGPADRLTLEPGERLSVITGDNGLGKTFLLDCAWWALSGLWARHAAHPLPARDRRSCSIRFRIGDDPLREVSYDWDKLEWAEVRNRGVIPGVVLYAQVDGSFAVWDPARDYWPTAGKGRDGSARPLLLSNHEVWNGLVEESQGRPWFRANGIIQDWILWQSTPKKYPFDTFVKVLKRLSPCSPSDLGPLEPGGFTRLPRDSRQFPTVKHPYGEVPVVHASAGVRRIIAMAYLLVWAWEEHKTHSRLIRRKPQRKMVVLVDEMEAHLHPQWQRAILPALLDVAGDLDEELSVQFLVATHSPLVLASVEPVFDEETDKLLYLDLDPSAQQGQQVTLEETPFPRAGLVDSWLTSDVFELKSPRSIEAERAIEEAKCLQLSPSPDSAAVRRVSNLLTKYLPDVDPFWPRWVAFAEKHGVRL